MSPVTFLKMTGAHFILRRVLKKLATGVTYHQAVRLYVITRK
jgi:hypothetical protein